MSVWPFFASLLAGWLVGGLANWAADRLPQLKEAQTDPAAPAVWHFLHYWTLWWYPWRRGICPHCAGRRPWRVPLLEVATALAFGLAWLAWADDPALLVVACFYAVFLLTVLVIDLEHRRVLNVMLLPAAVVALFFSALPGTPDPLNALLGGAVGFGLFLGLALIGRGALGAGDVKLAGVIGLMTGYPSVITALVVGILLGGGAALLLLLSRRASRKSYMAYAPYLSLGALFVLWMTLGG